MLQKITTYVTLICFIITLSGCSSESQQNITRESVPIGETKIAEVVTTDGTVYVFTAEPPSQYAMLIDSTIVGTLGNGQEVMIPMSKVTRVSVLRYDAAKSILLTLGALVLAGVLVIAIIAATKESCPFVYSYDGERYVFDGEPYGGAICEGLKRTDWCRLDYLKPVSKEYRLLLTNEVDETQYTDEFKLCIVDHSPDHEVLLDVMGNAYTVAQRMEPSRAWDNQGKDQMLWLGENDKLFWESDMRSRTPDNLGNLRDSIYLTFPRPKDGHYAKLVISGSTALWGSQMLKRMIQLRGEAIPQWHESMKSVENRKLLDLWNLREELYHLQVRVRVGEEWVTRGEIMGGGPFVTEERVVPLDLHGIAGETLEILLTPAAGFWQLNSFAVDYSENAPVDVQEIAAAKIIGDQGEDLVDVLSTTDGRYYAAPRNGQTASLVFPVPAAKPGTQRTVFAKASGYYEMHMDASGAPRTEILNRIAMEPGYPTAFAIEEFLKWKSEQGHASKTSEGETR